MAHHKTRRGYACPRCPRVTPVSSRESHFGREANCLAVHNLPPVHSPCATQRAYCTFSHWPSRSGFQLTPESALHFLLFNSLYDPVHKGLL